MLEEIFMIAQIIAIPWGVLCTIATIVVSVWSVKHKVYADKDVEKYKKELEKKNHKSQRYLDIIIESYKELCGLIGPLVESMQLIFDINELQKKKVYIDYDRLDEIIKLTRATKSKVMALAPFISKSVYDWSTKLIAMILQICYGVIKSSREESMIAGKSLAKISSISSNEATTLTQGVVAEWQELVKLISEEISPLEKPIN